MRLLFRLPPVACLGFAALLLGCPGNQPGSHKTPTSTATTNEKTPATEPQKVTTGRDLLPAWDRQLVAAGYSDQVAAALSASSSPQFVDVTFEGPILLITQGNHKRAVMVSGHGHVATLQLPKSLTKEAVTGVFSTADCSGADGCRVTLDEASLRLLGADAAESITTGDVTNAVFQSNTPHLGGYIAKEENFHADLRAQLPPHRPPQTKVASAFFDISRGVVHATESNKCRGRLNQNESPHEFTYSTTFRFAFRTAADLLIQTASGTQKLRLNGFRVPLTITNSVPVSSQSYSSCTSHFEMFERMADPPIDLPPVEAVDCTICTQDIEVPGCGNTQWP